MPRGRQYYDPIVQVPDKVEGAQDLSRIELYPEGHPDDPNPKWRGRLIRPDGAVGGTASGDFNHDRALRQAQELWPGLPVYELRSEGEDSTWEGQGPSPRLWQNSPSEIGAATPLAVVPSAEPPSDAVLSEAEGEAIPIRAFAVEAGTYMHVEDVRRLLHSYADVYDQDGNPSASLALRTAADMLQGTEENS